MHLFRYFLYLLAIVFHTSPTVWEFIAGFYGDFIALKKKKFPALVPGGSDGKASA